MIAFFLHTISNNLSLDYSVQSLVSPKTNHDPNFNIDMQALIDEKTTNLDTLIPEIELTALFLCCRIGVGNWNL